MSRVASLLVPKGLSPNIIEDLESNYQSIKSLYKKSVQLKDLLPEENFSLISRFLDDLKNYVNDYKSQENRSGVFLQKISIKLKHMQSELDEAVLNEKLLKDQAQDLRKFVQELETKIDGIKADPMMVTQGKAEELYQLIQVVKEKSFSVAEPIEDFYAIQEAKEAKKRQIDRLDREKRELEAQVQREKYDRKSKDYSLEMSENEIKDFDKKLEEVRKKIEEFEKPKLQTSHSEFKNASNKVFHYIFIADTSEREESQNVVKQIHSNIEAIKNARESTRDVFSLITFDIKAQNIIERVPIINYTMHALKDLKFQNHRNYFASGFNKTRQNLERSKDLEEIPIVILYIDGMRWYQEAVKPALEESDSLFRRIWNWILNEVVRNWRGQWSLKPIKENEIVAIKQEFEKFSSDRNLISFVSGTTMQNQEILRNFAKLLNRNETVLQTTIGEKYEYFNLASATEIFPKIFETLSIAERGPVSKEYLLEQARKSRQRETEDLRKEELDFVKNKLLKEGEDLKKKLNESLKKKSQIEYEIKSLEIRIEELQSEIRSIESRMTGLSEEIRLANQKISERERAMKEREKLEAKNAEIKTHLQTLEQLVKTVQARDHNILAIFEHVTLYCKDFLINLERVLRVDDETSGFDTLVKFYRKDLELYGTTDLETIEKICQLWFGQQEMTKGFFKLINPRDLIDNDLDIRKVGFESLNDLREEYQEFYRNLRRKIFVYKAEQKNSLKKEIKSLFSQDVEKLLEKLNERIYMMY